MRRGALAAALGLAACARPEGVPGISPISRAPDLRVGIALNDRSVGVGGGDRLAVVSSTSGWVGEIPAGEIATASVVNGALTLQMSGTTLSPGSEVTIAPAQSGTSIRVNGREYRGTFRLRASQGRVDAVNVVDLEDYLVGVVGAELGLRSEAEIAAVEAQAIVSRTIALQRAGQWRERGYDLVASIADQIYGGSGQENDLARRAVLATRGQILTYQGRVIDAFFHSTCAGRTANGVEVFAAADRPYLRSVSDLDPSGTAWCAISPRYRWKESWSGEELSRTLQQTLPLAGASPALASALEDIRILDRTSTGRVARLEIRSVDGSVTLTGPAARGVLKPADGPGLRSTDFTVQIDRDGDRITRLTIDGAGAGHGVGLCQWGAIGRARAGFSSGAILSAYFPGTELTRTY